MPAAPSRTAEPVEPKSLAPTPSSSTAAPDAPATHDHAAKMDAIYRWTRHIYDSTRKFYLFGRDDLLRSLNAPQNSPVLEVGCGTARNLRKLAALRPDLQLLGLDASANMLETAAKKLSPQLASRITLRQGLAEQLDVGATFGLQQPLPRIFFSYSLTMIPPWQGALDAALKAVPVGGEVHIVDFCDQGGWPAPVRWALKRWLSLFSVKFRPELLDYIQLLASRGDARLNLTTIYGRYAFIARLTRLR
jgi:S-adenosylmethionine-diacylgycerolhomoserine-N-methlytransferase